MGGLHALHAFTENDKNVCSKNYSTYLNNLGEFSRNSVVHLLAIGKKITCKKW